MAKSAGELGAMKPVIKDNWSSACFLGKIVQFDTAILIGEGPSFLNPCKGEGKSGAKKEE